MAIQMLVLTCDHCGFVADEYNSVEEACENGWWIVKGPERTLGGDGERTYCSLDCLGDDL